MSVYEYAMSNPGNWIDELGLCGSPCNKKPWWENGLNGLQTVLDVAGLIPGLGEIADGINAGIYAARGDYLNAALSAAAMIPGAGWGATAAKYSNKAGNIADAVNTGSRVAGGKPPIVIGETMDRVYDYVRRNGGDTFDPGIPYDKAEWMRRNEDWLREQMRQGREVVDIGPDFKKRSTGERTPSEFYEMERRLTKEYENYRKNFDRKGKHNQGKEGNENLRDNNPGGKCRL
jgi:hypothetical protein